MVHVVPSDKPNLCFDFGPFGSPVGSGSIPVSATTMFAGSALLAYGWQGGGRFDTLAAPGASNPVTGDGVVSTGGTFAVNLPNGTYDVEVTVGDEQASREAGNYWIEGVRLGSVSTEQGSHSTLTHRVEVHDGQLNLMLGTPDRPVTLNALKVRWRSDYVTPAADVDFTSGRYRILFENLDTGFVMRDAVEVAPGSPLCINGVMLEPNARYRQYVYHVETNTTAVSEFVTPASGVDFDLPEVPLGNRMAADSDGDGLDDLAEFIVGTNARNADSDNNGLSDLIALQLGQDPLGGRLLPNGVIASVALPGDAEAIDVAASPTNVNQLTAFIAVGSSGLAIADVSRLTTPTLLATLDLPGSAQDVAVDAERGIAAVAAGTGLFLIDVSNRAVPSISARVDLPGDIAHVRLRDGLAYVTHGGRISVIDAVTGDIRQTVDTGDSAIEALAVDAAGVYVVSGGGWWSSGTLRVYSTAVDGSLTARGTLAPDALSYQRVASIFAANGLLTLGVDNGFQGGLMTVNVSNPGTPVVISGVDDQAVAGRSVVLNGTGLAVAVGSPGGVFGRLTLDVLNLSDPANTGRLQASYPLSAAPRAVKIAGGMAYVADGSGGLVVVNYAGLDANGIAPTVSITADAVDADPTADGIQVVEGHPVTILPTVSDDVQIKSLELLVNGVVVQTLASYPYELVARAPLLAAGTATMTIQVRATDTGGNFSLSNEISVSVVADTFAPAMASISLADGDNRFALRSVELAFDELLDTSRLDPAKVFLVRAGGDGVFDTDDDVRTDVTLDVRRRGQALSIVVPGTLPAGDYRLTIDRTIIADQAGNQLATDIVRTFTIRSASDVKPESGFAAESTAPGANAGQLITLGVTFDPATARLDVPVNEGSGPSSRTLLPVRFDSDRGLASFQLPYDVVSGDVRLYSTDSGVADDTFPLQIVPVVTDAQVEWISWDSKTVTVLLSGYGFQEGSESRYVFGSTTVVDADVLSGYVDDTYVPNAQVRITLPLTDDSGTIGGAAFGAITASTAGGASFAFTRSLSIASTALSGTPADATLASANAGQAITLTGA
ncbi:hypothetical protein EBR04_05750, partial [bacterium]|nr:hypothetical protein [bacterium]